MPREAIQPLSAATLRQRKSRLKKAFQGKTQKSFWLSREACQKLLKIKNELGDIAMNTIVDELLCSAILSQGTDHGCCRRDYHSSVRRDYQKFLLQGDKIIHESSE